MDTTAKYSPDIIGDIHNLPFANDSQDAIICIAVLEHVENPIIAVKEIYRTLKHGGYCFIYVPFLFYYHAQTGYYKDYWRFSEDAIDLLFKDFKSIEKIAVRGRVETWMNFCPFKNSCFSKMGNLIDFLFHKSSKQVSGYNIFLIK